MTVHRVFSFTVIAIVFSFASTAGAQTIGPGSGITDAGDVDTPNQARLNIDRTTFVNLAAGYYKVDDFGLRVNTHDAGIGNAGTIAPMLLIGAPSNYTTLWVGPDYDPSANGVQTVGYTAGTEQFALGAAADVYAGVFTKNQGSAIIGLDANNSGSGSSQTDHDTSYTAPVGAGEPVAGISNPNLGRTYAFEVNISPTTVPTGALIGPGAATAGGSADGGGGRTNVEQDALSLAAGTYNVQYSEFYAVNTSGTVQPFLAERTTPGPTGQRYTPIWVGSAVNPTATGTNTDLYTIGDEQFTLAATTDVYAGFVMTETAVGYFGGGVTDHNGTPPLTPTVGVELIQFSNNNLGRSYSFGVNVALVPEPSTFALAALGLLGLLGWGSRRRFRI